MKNYNSIKKSSAGALSRLGRVLSLLTMFIVISIETYANTFYVVGNNYNYWDENATKYEMEYAGTNLYSVSITINVSNPFWFKILEVSSSNTYWSNNGSPVCEAMKDGWEFHTGTSDPCKFSCSSESTFTFTWNTENHKLSISSGGSPTPTTYTWYLGGSFTDWGANKIQFNGTGNTLTCSKNFAASQTISGCNKSSGFKIVRDDTWLGNDCSTITSSSTSATFSTAFGADNKTCGITTTLAGDYTFTLDITNVDSPSLTVTYPSNKPKVHIGTQPNVQQGVKATVYAYVKSTTCNTIDKIRAYYSASQFSVEPSTFVEITGDFERGSDNAIDILAAQLSSVIAGTGLVHVKVASHANETNTWSDLSDEVCFMWVGCQDPTVTVTPPSQTTVTPFDQFTITAEGACYTGDIEWSYTSSSSLIAVPIIEKEDGGSTINVRIPRPAGTVGTVFSNINYTFTATVRNGDNTSTGSCVITLTDADEDCTKH